MLEYDVVDVFTDRAFAGNPLAVVYGAEDLSAGQLAAVAREFNLSETTFPSSVGEGGYTVRIFTPSGEVPFAGHPTLGTAWALRARGELPGGRCVQHCGVGAVGVELPNGPEDPVALTAAPRDLPVEVAGEFAQAVGLAADDVDGPVLAAGCGLTFVHLPVHPEAVARARPAREVPAVTGVADPIGGIDVYAVPAAGEVRARVFCPEVAVPEDPATGSSAAGLGLVLQARGLLGEGGEYVVTQGVEMGRPSRLFGRVDGDVTAVWVSGHVVAVASGRIAVPSL